MLGYCAYTFAIGGFAYWAPKYLHDRYGLEPGRASFEFGLLTVAGGVVGTLVGGVVADFAVRAWRRRQGRDATLDGRAGDDTIARANALVAAVASAVGAPLALAAIMAPSVSGFFAGRPPCQVALCCIFTGPDQRDAVMLRASPPALRTTAMAICIFSIHAFGDLWSNPLIGLVADHAPMQWALYVVPFGFAIAAFVWWRASLASARLT